MDNFFHNMNKRLAELSQAQTLTEGAVSTNEGLGDVVRKVGAVAKQAGSRALDTLGHGSDQDLIKDLQKKVGVPPTGQKPGQPMSEKIEPPIKTNPAERGKYSGKDIGDLKSMKAANLDKTAAYRKRGEPVPDALKGKTAELNFALRAKQAHGGKWGKIKEDDMAEGDMDEGNAFTGKLASTPKGGSFKLGDKTFKDTSNLEEDLQADDGEHYDSFDDFIGRFDADSFDDVEEHSAGMQIRGYINGRNVMSWEFDDESKTSGYGNYDGTMLEAEQIDEIGDTPKGQAALRAVDARGTTAMDTWNKNPASGYTKAPKKTIQQFAGAMNAVRRLHGFGPDASAKDRAQRQMDYAKSMQAREQGMTEGTGGRYADELAQQVFANNPNLDASGPARELLNAAYALAVQQLGRKRAQSFFDDEDFPSDFVTAYAWEQEQDDYYKLPGRDDLPEMVAEGWDEMNAWLDQREKEKGTGRFDKKKISTGTVYSRKPETFDDPETGPEATGGAPKRRGRPAGAAKSPERVTAKSYKYKSGRPSKTAEGLDSDGVMMTRPSNMSSEGIEHGEQAEYNDEAGMAKDSLHTIVRSAKELERALRSNENLPEWVQEKIGQIKGMMSSVTDYILSTHERDAEQHMGREGVTLERAVSKDQAVAARIARGVQKGKVKARPGSASAEMAKMAPKELKKFAKTPTKGLPKQVEEESTGQEDQRAEKAGKRVTKDIEHDEGHRGRDDNRAERAGKKVTKDIEYDDAKDRKEKKSKTVKETDAAPKTAGKGAYKFGGGVYESLDRDYQQQLNEGMSVNISMDEAGNKTVNVTATQEDAAALADLLNLAGMQRHTAASSSSCDQDLEENSPDWPTNTETLAADPNLRTYSGGVDGPKSTGQSVQDGGSIPALRRAMGENVELERSLFKLYQNYKAS